MRRFRFRLERLLSVRRLRTQLHMQNVAAARAQLHDANERRAQTQAQYEAATIGVCQREAAGMTASMLLHGRQHVGGLASLLAGQTEAVAVAEQQLRAAQAELADARQAERALERLRERRWQQYEHESLKHQQRQLDEISMARAVREAMA